MRNWFSNIVLTPAGTVYLVVAIFFTGIPTSVFAALPSECPFTGGVNNVSVVGDTKIVKFTGKIVSSGTASQADSDIKLANLPAGNYKVSLYSYDEYVGRELVTDQPNEQWQVLFKNSLTVVATSSIIDDLPDGVATSTRQQIVDNSLTLPAITHVVAHHAFYPNVSANSVFPVCASFELLSLQATNTPPTITLVGSSTMNLTVNSVFTDPGASSTDAEDGNLTSSIVVTGNVATSTIGTYTLVYSVTDSGSLSASTTRMVNVQPQNNPPPTTTNGGGGGGGGGSSRPPTSSTSTPTLIPTLECFYLRDYMRRDFDNDPVEVLKLQAFLINFEGYSSVALTGVFDQATFDAVSLFQMKYFSDILEPWGHTRPTGYVYILTIKKINEIYCQRVFPLEQAQLNEIIAFRALLESLGAEKEADTSTTTPPILPIVGEVKPSQGQNIRNLAAAIFAQPETLLDTVKCLYEFLLIQIGRAHV